MTGNWAHSIITSIGLNERTRIVLDDADKGKWQISPYMMIVDLCSGENMYDSTSDSMTYT